MTLKGAERRMPLRMVSFYFLCGVIFACLVIFFKINIYIVLFFTLLILITLLMIKKVKETSLVFLMLLVAVSGALKFTAFNDNDRGSVKYLFKKNYTEAFIRGRIASEPIFKRRFNYLPELSFILRVEAVKGKNEWLKSSGRIYVKLYYSGKEEFLYGDLLEIEGDVKRPVYEPSGSIFSYNGYLLSRNVNAVCLVRTYHRVNKLSQAENFYANIRRKLFHFKADLTRVINLNVPPPASGLITAMLLGSRQEISDDTKDVFVKTGTMHVLAISGLHVGLIVAFILFFLKMLKVNYKASYSLCMVFILCYALFIGGRASVWRAVLMTIIILSGRLINRRAELGNALSLALIILLALNPNYIFDIGFILSFSCLFSIIYITPILNAVAKGKSRSKGPGNKLKLFIVRSLTLSFGVFIGVGMLSAYSFGIIAPASIIGNLIAVPVCFLLVSGAIIALLCYSVLPGIALLIFSGLAIVGDFLLMVLKGIAMIPGAYFLVRDIKLFHLIAYYVILMLFISFFSNRSPTRKT